MKKTRVVFVGGYGRSGSTIIDLLLNRVPGVIAVGEFRHLFGRALGDNELCSCGKPFRDCPFWGRVITEAFPNGSDRKRIQQAVKRFNRLVMLPKIRHPEHWDAGLQEDARIYRDAFAAAYRAVVKVSGARVVVDSTKYPLHGWFLSTMPELELSAMMLVRDPRAVAFSWERRRLRPEVHWEKREMPRHHVARSALAWNLSNSLTAALKKRLAHYRVQRYEDFVADPITELTAIASFALGEPVKLSPQLFERQPHVPHTLAGNPVRIGSEQVRVKDDDEWRSMPLWKRLTVTVLCCLGIRRYGYRLRVK
ncbi:MAG TPA: sulfotransferase [Candidatus Saccharimonadales bacterium]|nr:sulfotransferase [Candidatus Saccharimonadales bacterium]